jgi:hypothetical protein
MTIWWYVLLAVGVLALINVMAVVFLSRMPPLEENNTR